VAAAIVSQYVCPSVPSPVQTEAACPPKLCMTLVQHLSREYKQRPKVSSHRDHARRLLTYRQLELLGLVAQGMSNKEIAANLNLSEYTVKNRVRRIVKQVDADDRHEAVCIIRASSFLHIA
jgi:DNA-binding NarL/FixJ family response regulator